MTPAVTQRLACSPGPKMPTFMPKDFDVVVQSSASAPARLDKAVWGMMPVHLLLHMIQYQTVLGRRLDPLRCQHTQTERSLRWSYTYLGIGVPRGPCFRVAENTLRLQCYGGCRRDTAYTHGRNFMTCVRETSSSTASSTGLEILTASCSLSLLTVGVPKHL